MPRGSSSRGGGGAVASSTAAGGGGLSLRSSNKEAALAGGGARGNTKRKATEQAVKAPTGKKRAALGEITNAFSETTSQAKKGLKQILNKSRSKLGNSSSGPSSLNNSTTSSSGGGGSSSQKSSKSGNKKGALEEVPEDDEILYGATQSLPSSQEPVVPLDVQEEIVDAEDENMESLYQSAGESLAVSAGPPEGVADFDVSDDPNQCAVYAMEIFSYYKSREEQFRVPDYIGTTQPELTTTMRAVLVDWLVEVQESFELNHETLYTAIKIVDLYLSKVHSRKNDLQLVGATSMLLACKIDERIPPMLDDFVFVCDGACDREVIKAKEIEIVSNVEFDLGFPLSYRFLRRYGRVCRLSMTVLTFGRYLLELCLMEYKLNVETSESMLATAAMIFTLKVFGIYETWAATLEYYSGYTLSELKPLVEKVHTLAKHYESLGETSNTKTIRTKYSHHVFHSVALTQIPDEIEL